jgi:hypothetical protein
MRKKILTTLLLSVLSIGLFAQDVQKTKTDSIIFEKTAHDYGTIEYGSDGIYEFRFTNKGENPLILTNVRAACGCTTPVWPKEPVKPGESDVIKVKYNIRIQGKFRKTIRVNSTAANSYVILTITGTVKPKQ